MSDKDIFDTGIDMEPLKKMMWDWCVLEFSISRKPSESIDKYKEDSRRLEFQIVDYVLQADWQRQNDEADEFAEKRRAAKESEDAD